MEINKTELSILLNQAAETGALRALKTVGFKPKTL
jgi:hypothetical protein